MEAREALKKQSETSAGTTMHIEEDEVEETRLPPKKPDPPKKVEPVQEPSKP
jgi:hypothetical protein